MENHHHFYIRCQKIVKKTNFWYEISEKNWGIFLTTYFFLVISYQKLVFLTILWHGIKKLMRYPPCINLSHVWKLLKRPTFDMKSLKKNRGRKNTIILLKKHLFWLKMTVLLKIIHSDYEIDNFTQKSTDFEQKSMNLDIYTSDFLIVRPKQHILKKKHHKSGPITGHLWACPCYKRTCLVTKK
jgi:hypothetical protein